MCIGVGVAVKLLCDAIQSAAEITWGELLLGSLVVIPILASITTLIGWNMAVNQKTSFNEYWGGWELTAVWDKVRCVRDGSCVQSYKCDSYSCNPHKCNCDSNGKNCSTCYDTCYRDCPYCTEEWNFSIKTTIGDFVIRKGGFPDNPVPWRGSSIPTHVLQQAGVGIPKFWADAKARIDAGKPGPATKINVYENLIIANDDTILKQFSKDIEFYQSSKHLPSPAKGIYDFYYADKVMFVGYNPANAKLWQDTLAYLNADFGDALQGTMEVVVVQSPSVSQNPDRYSLALRAYWLDRKSHKMDTIAKNAFVVIIGTDDGKSVSWARAFSGMPVGNELLLAKIANDLPGTSLTPEALFGSSTGEFYIKEKSDGSKKLAVRGLHSGGKIADLVFGLSDQSTKFVRVSMNARDATDVGTGFSYLKGEITPDDDQKPGIIIIGAFLGSCITWVVFAVAIGTRKGYYTSFYR